MRVDLPEMVHELAHFLDGSPQFVAEGEHHERRVMAIGADDTLALVVEICHQPFIVGHEVTPERQFRLEVDAQHIGSEERSFGWTPRVETHVVDAVVFAFAQVGTPCGIVHGHMGGEWEYTGIMLAA